MGQRTGQGGLARRGGSLQGAGQRRTQPAPVFKALSAQTGAMTVTAGGEAGAVTLMSENPSFLSFSNPSLQLVPLHGTTQHPSHAQQLCPLHPQARGHSTHSPPKSSCPLASPLTEPSGGRPPPLPRAKQTAQTGRTLLLN